MLITLCAIVVSALMLFFLPLSLDFEVVYLATIMLVGGTSILFATLFLNTTILTPFENLEQKLIPNLMDLLGRDIPLKMGRFYLFLFALISYLCVAFASRIEDAKHHWFFFIWLVFFGLALDILRDNWQRVVNLLNPSFLISQISQQARKAIQNDKRDDLLNELNHLAEIGVHAVERTKLALSTQTLQTFPPILKNYFDSTKSIGHASQVIKELPALQGRDASSFIVFYLMQRFELINDKALRDRQETVCRQMIMTMGKIIVHCAACDLSLVSFPTHFLTKFGLKAQQHYFDEVTDLTTGTLLEIAKTIVTEIDVTYAELQDPFQAIINGLTAIARATFKKQKDMNIQILLHPFVDLKALFQTEKMINHRDTPAIIRQLDNVIDEFSILEQVMQTIPSVGIGSSDTDSIQPASAVE